MSERKATAEQFLADVKDHGMIVALDKGVYRHIVFQQPRNSNLWFEIITWPGGLTIHGDMGTWAFSRVPDMFNFFRSSELKINASYWSEKITSESRFGGPSQKFHPEKFKAAVLSSLDSYDDGGKPGTIEALADEVFSEEDEVSARRALAEFEYGDFKFSDPWEINGHDYTYHFLWCLYAIVWAIQQYDAAKVPA